MVGVELQPLCGESDCDEVVEGRESDSHRFRTQSLCERKEEIQDRKEAIETEKEIEWKDSELALSEARLKHSFFRLKGHGEPAGYMILKVLSLDT